MSEFQSAMSANENVENEGDNAQVIDTDLKSMDSTWPDNGEPDNEFKEFQSDISDSPFDCIDRFDNLPKRRRMASECEYGNVLRYMQKRASEMPSTNLERARISAAKEIFKHSGAEFLFRREHYHKKEHIRPRNYDLKADIEYNKDSEVLLRRQFQQNVQKAAKVTNFRGLEPVAVVRPTIKPEEQEQIAESARVSHFQGLQSSSKTPRTAEASEIVSTSKLFGGNSPLGDASRQKKLWSK